MIIIIVFFCYKNLIKDVVVVGGRGGFLKIKNSSKILRIPNWQRNGDSSLWGYGDISEHFWNHTVHTNSVTVNLWTL